MLGDAGPQNPALLPASSASLTVQSHPPQGTRDPARSPHGKEKQGKRTKPSITNHPSITNNNHTKEKQRQGGERGRGVPAGLGAPGRGPNRTNPGRKVWALLVARRTAKIDYLPGRQVNSHKSSDQWALDKRVAENEQDPW